MRGDLHARGMVAAVEAGEHFLDGRAVLVDQRALRPALLGAAEDVEAPCRAGP